MCNKVDLISEIYEDITTEILQIPRRQPPHSGLTTVLREKIIYCVQYDRPEINISIKRIKQ